jgi:YidC/Oxa1 family membrane protein insertase
MMRYQSKMKRIQPKIDEIKKRYEKDPSKLRQEQALIMQKEGAFPPLGGCLPPLLQIPVFIGLFRAIGVSFDLRQASFLGLVRDLSLPDQLIPLHMTLPLLGEIHAINVLPPVMVILWVWQQRSMPAPTDPQAASMHKMMMWMPVLMGVFLYNYAAGLSLYMITSSALAIFETKVIKKFWPIDDRELPQKPGLMAKMAKLAEQSQKMREQQARPKARR